MQTGSQAKAEPIKTWLTYGGAGFLLQVIIVARSHKTQTHSCMIDRKISKSTSVFNYPK